MAEDLKDPLNQVKSLVGKIEKDAMGQKNIRTKPKKILKTKPKKNENHHSFKGGDILQEQFIVSTYQPKTKQNRLIYEKYIGKIYGIAEDQPPQILQSIVEEVLAVVMGDGDNNTKKSTVEAIMGEKVQEDIFLDICNIAKGLTDYYIDEEDKVIGQAIAMEDQEQSQNDSEQIIEEQEIERQEDNMKFLIEAPQQQNKLQKMKIGTLDTNLIDAYWLQNQLTKYYDVTEIQQIEKNLIKCLNVKTKLQAESQLLSILNYEKYQLVHLILNNRLKIYYCTRYHQSSNEKQKEQLLEQMKIHDIQIGRNGKKEEQNKNVEQLPRKKNKMEVQNQDEVQFEQIKGDEILKINKKMVELTLHETVDRTINKQEYKFKLPEGAQKIGKPGYEEVYIPSIKRTVKGELREVSTIPEWMQPAFKGIKRFNSIQSKVIQYALNSNGNILICAPTSAGKTNIALLAILQTISHYRHESYIDTSKFKIVYIAPMKALVAEVTGNLQNKLSPLGIRVKQLTGDMHLSKGQIEDTQIIVSTPEKWDIITRKAGDRLFTQQVKLLIIDEIHLLSDSRGPVLESIIARTIRQVENTEQTTRIVGLSATLPNYKDVSVALRVKNKQGLFYFDQSYRPIPLNQLYIGITEKKGVRKMLMINQILYEKVIERVTNQQMIIFVHSRRDTVRTARTIYQTAFGKNQLNRIIKPDSESKKILQAIVDKQTINSTDLKQLLTAGIGIHHAGLSRGDRDLVEQLFADRHFNILISTATLAWGVNLPAHTVIIKGTQVYSAEQGRWIDLSLQDVMQMMGRAGRPMYDQQGQGIILTGYEEIRYYLGLLNMQIALQSQLIKSLPDQLNAQIVLGSICNLKDAVNWLSYTYLYVRMLKNPSYYSISVDQIQEDPQLLKRRVNLVHTAAIILQKNGLVSYDRKNGGITTTFLGKIASYYYIKYPSMAIYNSNLKNSSGLIELLKIFSMSIEFKYLNVREQEKNQLKKLIQSVPVPIKGTVQESTTKIAALLQAHISKLQLDGYALNADKIYVTQSASRIIRALFQICLKRGWGQTAQCCLQLAKMVDKSMWNCLNPLRQFKQIPQYVLSKLEKKQQFSWQSFYQMNPQQIGDLTKFPKLGKILHKFVHHVPRVNIDAYAQPLTRSCLHVQLTIKVDFRWEDQFHGKQQPFWLLVFDCNQQNILFSYYFTFSKKLTQFNIKFIVPLFQILHPLYFVKVISDRWICSDNTLPLSFKNMILPSKFQPSTELLDLQSIPVTSLSPLAKQLKINHLNQIQTQTYPAFMNSNKNIFLGANQGSGKFTMALFAIQKQLQIGNKVIVLVPQRSLARLKLIQLSKLFYKKKVAMLCEELSKDMIILSTMDLIISTPIAFDVLSRRYKARKGFTSIGLIIVDSLHLMGQNKSIMEVVVSRIRYISNQSEQHSFRLICLSSSIADYKEISQWIGATSQTTFNFHPSIRSNSLGIIFNSYDQNIRQSRLHMMQKHIMQQIRHYNRNAIIIVNDKKQTKLTSLDFISLLSNMPNPKKMRKISDQQMKIFSKKIIDQFLVHVLEYGIGYLYEGMNQMEFDIVEKLFQIDGINILVISQQLKWQINLKAFIVAVLDCSYYDCYKSQWQDYSIAEMIQFMSMSSIGEKDKYRGKQYSSSKFMIMCLSAKKNYYKKFLFEPYPIESTLHLNLNNHLNGSIVVKNIHNKQDCIDWLTWTFFYRRLTSNPSYYNLQEISEESISSYLSQLIQNSIQYLQGIKCIEIENQNDLTSTNLGIICSYYYLNVETLSRFVQKITQNIKLENILSLICQAQQLQHYTYYPNEQQYIAQLLLPLNQIPNNKVHALLLLYLSRINLNTNLQYYLKEILPIFVKLIHAFVDIISSFGFLKPLILSMQLCQMIIQAMWINDSPLLQVMSQNVAMHLQQNYAIKDINSFLNMDEENRTNALKGKDINKIANACNRYPMITISHEIIQQNQEEISIKVILQRDYQLEKETVISPYYPVQKQQYWWIIIGDKKINRVLTTKKTLIKLNAAIDLNFQKTGNNHYSIYVLCDSYIGCDQINEISLQGT